jgi:hypothetical protein|tara:strand:+ start:219 stop:617 length:399 start_codon:yes stop_codon:yes gene_type:complete
MNSRELFERRDELKDVISGLRIELKDVEEQLSDTFLPLAKDVLRSNGKDFGTAQIVEGNQRLKVTVGKKVSWDQDMLRDVLNTMSPEDAQHYGKLTFAVEERKFTAAPPAIRNELQDCRTVEVGSVKVEELE